MERISGNQGMDEREGKERITNGRKELARIQKTSKKSETLILKKKYIPITLEPMHRSTGKENTSQVKR
jgi:hypothetical protein